MKKSIPTGQLYITGDFRLSKTPTSYYGLRNMSASTLIKRNKRIGKQKDATEEEAGEGVSGTNCKLARIQAINSPVKDSTPPEEVEFAQTITFSDSDNDEGDNKRDSDVNSDLEEIEKKSATVTEAEVDSPEIAKWIAVHTANMKRTGQWSALLLVTMLNNFAPINNYPKAYDAYRTLKEFNEEAKRALWKMLSAWGRLYINKPSGISFLQDLMLSDEQRRSWSTIVFHQKHRKTLKEWLNRFCEELDLPEPTSVTDLPPPALPHSTLPSPVPHTATCTSFMPAIGLSHIAGVQDSEKQSEPLVGKDVPANLERYKLKTSKTLSSMSFNQGEFRCTLRSPNNCGDLAVKLETYRWMDIRNKATQDWWRSAEVKGFVLCPMNSRLGNLAAQMEVEMRRILESDNAHEGELQYRK